MKHTTDDLLLAAAVIQRAVQIRSSATADMTAEQAKEDAMTAGDKYVAAALKEFRSVASFIAQTPAE